MKSAIPWICVVALLCGAGFLYSSNRSKDAELIQLRQQSDELSRLRAENEELSKLKGAAQELERLQKDNADLPRLRSEVQQLRERTKDLANQLQLAQTKNAQAQQQQQQQMSQLASENQALHEQAQKTQQANAVQGNRQAAICANNLRQIEAAKQQWATENNKAVGSTPTAADLAPYIPNIDRIACPSGGSYTINAVGTAAACSTPGHALQ
jgi:DNA repair exonuclease SbcCD ATPase subunit